MMDGRIRAIREAARSRRLDKTGIISYAANLRRRFTGIREAAESPPSLAIAVLTDGFRQRNEALREVALDIDEGADI